MDDLIIRFLVEMRLRRGRVGTAADGEEDINIQTGIASVGSVGGAEWMQLDENHSRCLSVFQFV